MGLSLALKIEAPCGSDIGIQLACSLALQATNDATTLMLMSSMDTGMTTSGTHIQCEDSF